MTMMACAQPEQRGNPAIREVSSQFTTPRRSDRRTGSTMKAKQLAAIVLIVVGTLGLIYRGFSYTRETHEAKFGAFELSISRKTRIDVPLWASVGLIVVGVGILVVRSEG